MTSTNKSSTLSGIYEDNLYHVVRGERRSEVNEPERLSNYRYIGIGSVVFSVIVSIVAISFSSGGNVSLAQTIPTQPRSAELQNSLESVQQENHAKATDHVSLLLAKVVPTLYKTKIDTSDGLSFHPPLQLQVTPNESLDMDLVNKAKFSLVNLFGLGVKTIVIDPGHGGKDPGAIGRDKILEKDIALELAQRIKRRLIKRGGYKVLLTREDDRSMSLQERVRFANSKTADLFISIHVNAFSEADGNFVETYYFGATEDTAVAELAARENSHSDYRYTDFKHMIQHISDTLKFQESKSLAAHVQHSLYNNVNRLNNKTADHGIKPGPFVVLLGLEAPSILTEVANLSNIAEEKRLKSGKYRDKIAKFLEKGIVNYLNNGTTLAELR